MTPEQKKAWGWTLGILLLLWGVVAPPLAYWQGMKAGFKKGAVYSAEEAKKTLREAKEGLKQAASNTATVVIDSVSSAGVSVASGASVLAAGLTSKTAELMEDLDVGFTSATQAAGAYKESVTSYTAGLAEDVKSGASRASDTVLTGARRAKDVTERQTSRVVSGVKRRLAKYLEDDEATSAPAGE